jgi:hypothetical protein
MSRVSRAEVSLGAPPVVEDATEVVVESPKPAAPKGKAKSTESEESSA